MTTITKLRRALDIIQRNIPEGGSEEVGVGHDTLYAGCYSETFAKMSDSEKKQMEECGFFEDEETDSWQVWI